MKELLKAISLVLEWHDGNLKDGVNRDYAIRELRQAYEAAQLTIDWRKLREDFFNECVEEKRICIAPHDLFEWFKRKLLEDNDTNKHNATLKAVFGGVPEL